MPAAVLYKKICHDIQISFYQPLILFRHGEKKASQAVKMCVLSEAAQADFRRLQREGM